MTEDRLIDKRMQKVALLLKKAESTTPAEAEALQAKAAELLELWHLDSVRVRALAGEATPIDDPFESQLWEVKVSSMAKAHGELAYRVAAGSNCKPIYWGEQTKHKVRLKVFGRRSDLERAALLRASISMQLASALTAWTAERLEEQPYLKGTWPLFVEQRSFVLAYASAVANRLAVARREARKLADEPSVSTPASREALALAIRDETARLDEFVNESCGKLSRMRQSSQKYDYNGAAAGQAAASRAQFGSTRLQTGPRAIGSGS